MIRPPALRPGSRVALVAAAGPVPEGGVDRAAARVRELGWEPVAGRFCRGRTGYLAGSDAERASDLNDALRDPAIDAVWFLRGGYGTMRILDAVDWPALARRPKALIGYSDNTAVHLAANAVGVVAFHGPHPHPPEFPDFAREGLLRVLSSTEPSLNGPARWVHMACVAQNPPATLNTATSPISNTDPGGTSATRNSCSGWDVLPP